MLRPLSRLSLLADTGRTPGMFFRASAVIIATDSYKMLGSWLRA